MAAVSEVLTAKSEMTAAEMGRKGGLTRAKRLSKAELRAIAMKGVRARQKKKAKK